MKIALIVIMKNEADGRGIQTIEVIMARDSCSTNHAKHGSQEEITLDRIRRGIKVASQNFRVKDINELKQYEFQSQYGITPSSHSESTPQSESVDIIRARCRISKSKP